MSDDPLTDIEAKNAVVDWAKVLRGFYDELLGQGFSKRDALQILLGYQESQLGGRP